LLLESVSFVNTYNNRNLLNRKYPFIRMNFYVYNLKDRNKYVLKFKERSIYLYNYDNKYNPPSNDKN